MRSAVDLHGPAKDLDLLGSAEAAAVRQRIATVVPEDGLRFDPATATAAEIREEQEYRGIRVKPVATLGNVATELE